jgi:sulfite reductase beta subunit-like hemoprotein
VPAEELQETVDRLVSSWLAMRRDGEDFRAFSDRLSDEELGILAGREPARGREKEAA